MSTIQRLLIAIINVYTMVIFLRAIISWFRVDPYSEWYRWMIRITEPALAPIRRLLPTMGLDFSPFILLILLDFLKRIILGIL
jgi:YggT family protein